ncbi:MAG: DUF3786 domain-containing protein [Lachnospiraceae bacterium]
MNLQYDKDNKERLPWEHYLEAFQTGNPVEMSDRVHLPYDEERREFTFEFLQSRYTLTFPEAEFIPDDASLYRPLPASIQAKILMLRYLTECVYKTPGADFLTYREMPSGELYFRQFQGRCLTRFAYAYGNKQDVFTTLMEQLGAQKLTFADVSYEIELLNKLSVRLLLWEGDEEFPPSSQILFSDNFKDNFSAEDMAVVGDIIIGTLKQMEKELK